MKRYYVLGILSIGVWVAVLLPHNAQALANDAAWQFANDAIAKGYTAEFDRANTTAWGNFRLAVMPNLVNEPIALVMKEFDGSERATPPGLTPVSHYYLYDILRQNQTDKTPLIVNRPLVVSIKFSSSNFFRKKIYFWANSEKGWVALPSTVDYANGYVRAYTHLPFSRLAVFEDSRELEGKASWYRSAKHPFGAACNNYPLGTKLRVRNVDTNKTVDVEVVSTGPFSPERVIDLTLSAFKQIELSWKGLVRVQVTPLDGTAQVLGVDTTTLPAQPAAGEPRPQSAAAVAIKLSENERVEDILYSKNYDEVRSIASLTKLMTAAVFLDTGTPMDKIVTYDKASDDTSPAGSRLKVGTGETMKVKDLFYTMLVGSANNAARALARSTGLSPEEFVRRMNDKAQTWGLTHTHFVEPTGLDPKNVSTVYEVALMAKQVFKDFRILQATTVAAYGFRTINANQPHTIKTTAAEMFDSPFRVTGMKTGFLEEAGYCYVLKARAGSEGTDHDVITVVLGAGARLQSFNEATNIANYAQTLL